jgi:heptosyltransferase-1
LNASHKKTGYSSPTASPLQLFFRWKSVTVNYDDAMFGALRRETFRRPSNYALACATELARPILRAFAASRSYHQPTSPEKWKTGLLIGHSHIGDVLYNTPSLPFLKQSLPGCKWFWATEPAACHVLANNPVIERCIVTSEVEKFHQDNPFDVAICYNHSDYSGYLLRTAKLGIPNRVGFIHKGLSGLVTHPIQLNFPQTAPGYFRDFVGQLTQQNAEWPLRPLVYPAVSDEEAAQRVWNELGLANETVLACFVTSRQPTGVLPLDRFGEILQLIQKRFSGKIVLCGAPGDKETLEKLRQRFGIEATVLAGKLPLLALVRFLAKCAVVLTTDSGPRHLANAARVPVVFIRNLWADKIESGVYCESEFDMAPDVHLLPTEKQAEHFSRVSSTEVAGKVLECIERSPFL